MCGTKSLPGAHRILTGVTVLAGAMAGLCGPVAAYAAATTYSVGPITDVSGSCSGQNAEVEQAVDPALHYVYETWMGCKGIGFGRSVDGGLSFQAPISLPGSVGSNVNSWDPAVAVAPDGTVYAAFMLASGTDWYPVVAASFDHGVTFPQVSSLLPPDHKNWGDRDFIAVGPDGTVYLTWDYGPERTSVTYICATSGSCAFATGDLNVVIQKSTDHGATWSAQSHISPGFPASGGDSAPLVVEPNGRIDVLYQGYQITNTTTYTMNPAYSYFTASSDQGQTWSAPVRVGASGGTMSLAEWWIDGAIGIDSGGNLYATWDTQGTNPDGSANDVGWLSFSTDRGQTWSAPLQAPADRLDVPHIMEVAGGGPGIAFVGWLSDSNPQGYAQYLRTFSVTRGWLSDPAQVSTQFGDPSVWPGDTFGISTLSTSQVVLSWGSATPSSGKKSDIFAARVGVQLR
ncbi:MAG: exo-alpha-sialidase [Chloroflexi bacterium]|nr:MAG: exo-alpha-sialidase [Chloroflexota bacterium]